MIYHRIKDVEPEVCTKEQLLAYTMSVAYGWEHQYVYQKALRSTAINAADIFVQVRSLIMDAFRSRIDQSRYDQDAFFCVLNAGLPSWLANPKLSCEFAEIGQMFPANYLGPCQIVD